MAPTIAGLLFLLSLSGGGAQVSCPSDHPVSRRITERFLTSPGLVREREESGVAGTTVSQVRLLADSTDAEACRRFVEKFGVSGGHPEWHWSVYQAGEHYYVAFRRIDKPGRLRMEFQPLFIFDRAFEQVGGYGM